MKILNFPTNRKTVEPSQREPVSREDADAKIDEERLRAVPIVEQAIFFLKHAGAESGIKLTEKGFLGRNFVHEFWGELLSKADDQPFRPTREGECPEATRIHSLLAEMKYVRKFKGTVRLTPKGLATFKSGTCCELYRDLLEAGTFRWNWGYDDRYSDFDFIQGSAPRLIARLMYWLGKLRLGMFKYVWKMASILILATGCSTSNSRQIHSQSREPSSIETPSCSPTGESNQICMNTFKVFGAPGAAACAATPIEALISKLTLPFDSSTEVVCTHSFGSGSHSGANAFFALDLATAYSLPAATVRASADGKVYVFSGDDGKLCPEPQVTPASAKSSDCGNSWGNHTMISHGNGYASFYVHLDHFLISNGTYVHQGDPIGIMGWTGAAGHRHLHWSIQKIQGSTQAEWDSALSKGWTGASVPFLFLANQSGRMQNFDVTKIKCAHASIGSARVVQQPVFRGIDAAQ